MVRRGWSSSLLLFVGFLLLAGCSDDKSAAVCDAPPAGKVRAPEGDSLCVEREICSTSGQPDHQGCPNTCSCLCHEGLCYENSCTAIASCTEAAQYR